jgi:hypothetical protein
MHTMVQGFDKHLFLKQDDRTYYTQDFDFVLKKSGLKWKMYSHDEVDGSTDFIAEINSYEDFLDHYFYQTFREYEGHSR